MKAANRITLLYLSQAGCLLPALAALNFLFGWMFFKPAVWLGIEAALILLLIVTGYLAAVKIKQSFSAKDNAVDVEGEVVEEKKQLK